MIRKIALVIRLTDSRNTSAIRPVITPCNRLDASALQDEGLLAPYKILISFFILFQSFNFQSSLIIARFTGYSRCRALYSVVKRTCQSSYSFPYMHSSSVVSIASIYGQPGCQHPRTFRCLQSDVFYVTFTSRLTRISS